VPSDAASGVGDTTGGSGSTVGGVEAGTCGVVGVVGGACVGVGAGGNVGGTISSSVADAVTVKRAVGDAGTESLLVAVGATVAVAVGIIVDNAGDTVWLFAVGVGTVVGDADCDVWLAAGCGVGVSDVESDVAALRGPETDVFMVFDEEADEDAQEARIIRDSQMPTPIRGIVFDLSCQCHMLTLLYTQYDWISTKNEIKALDNI
jgi:hypothetical protein